MLEEPGVIALVKNFRDITKRKESEKLIQASEAKYRSFFESSIDGILLTVTDGKILSANPAACEIFNMTEPEICAAGRMGLVDLSDPRLYALLEERKQTGRAKGELTLLRKDGSKFEAELTSAVFTDSSGQTRTSMIVRDVSERKEVEFKLNQTSKELQHILHDLNKIMDSSIDIICVINEAGRFVQMSAASQAIWGYSPQELINVNLFSMLYADDIEKTEAISIKIQRGVPASMFENRYVHKNGSIIPMLWSASWDENDKLMYCIGKDATEKKKLEKAYEIERQRFLELYFQAPSCMGILKGPNHVYELANPLYLQLIDRSDIIGKTVKEVLPELESQGIFDFLDTVYTTGNTFSANEMRVQFDHKGTGELVDTYLNFIYQAHRDNEGQIDGIVFFAIDVTEQVLSRRKIEESEKRYRQIVETAQEGIWVIDENHKTTFVNSKMCEILEYSEAEMMGKKTSRDMPGMVIKNIGPKPEKKYGPIYHLIRCFTMMKPIREVWRWLLI
jgi:PAS domain S-box-containing protein